MLGFRGYPDRSLFTGWPSPVHWSLVRVERDELPMFRYIKHEGWDEPSGGTRNVVEGARRLLAGEPQNETADQYAIRANLPLGSIVAATDGIDCTLVEGHHRVTYPYACPDSLEVYWLVATASEAGPGGARRPP